MEIKSCDELKNIFICDNVLYKHRVVIAIVIAVVLFLILNRNNKKKKTRNVIIAGAVGLIYVLTIDKILNAIQDMKLDENGKMLKQEMSQSLVENCKLITGM